MLKNVINRFRRKKASQLPELTEKLRINGREAELFERALQLYIFAHHVPHKRLPDELAEQLAYTGHAVYSLLLNWLRDGKPSLEYMDFLNEKVTELRRLSPHLLEELHIKPDEADQIELQKVVRLRFLDEESGRALHLAWHKEEKLCYHDAV